jgi:hypothetical protein
VANSPGALVTTGTTVPSAGRVREFLARLRDGDTPGTDPAVWSSLAPRGALTGTVERPEMTPVGRQVLRELELRGYRTDGLPLDAVAAEIERGVTDLATMADTAEYFLAELGPVPPVDVVPLLRVVAAHLAVQHESPEDLVEEFKNGWGGVEVMGSTPADRLLAAELITASNVPQEDVYSSMMTTVGRLTDAGCRSPVSTAAILHLYPRATTNAPLDRWAKAREHLDHDEGAALLAGAPDVGSTLARWEGNVAALGGVGADAQLTAVYLTTATPADRALAGPVRDGARMFEGTFALPRLAAALALCHLGLPAAESRDWFDKSLAQATARRLAPDPAQLAVLGLALLVGLDPERFHRPPTVAPAPSGAIPSSGLVARTALHAWMYRDLVRGPGAPR